jgi:spore maturation protein CgeB
MRAARRQSIEAEICDMQTAWRHGTIAQKFLWHFCGRRPIALESFSRLVIESCRTLQPDVLLATGTAPISREALRECQKRGVRRINFSTDDPFNPLMRAPWFLRALPEYDTIFSPRLANLDELRAHGCRDVRYLPFGYDPDLFFPGENTRVEETSDLFFAGTAEPSRVEYVSAAVRAGLDVRLYGNYWGRYRGMRGISRGQADIPTLRNAIASCKVALCLVRHENRDGHSMRTFEVPAVGACMVTEDSVEHRQIFGADGEHVTYFKNPSEMVEKTKFLLENRALRQKLRDAVHLHVVKGGHTYGDRLRTMLNSV